MNSTFLQTIRLFELCNYILDTKGFIIINRNKCIDKQVLLDRRKIIKHLVHGIEVKAITNWQNLTGSVVIV